MTTPTEPGHGELIKDQFTRQASGFAAGAELHADDILRLMVDAAAVDGRHRAIDVACGPGSVACALARQAGAVVGLDATPAMLHEARQLADRHGLTNVSWQEGSVYAVPFADGSFDAVTCRFAFHHLEDPPMAFAEMVRLAAPGGRIVLCDGIAADDPAEADAFNAMERRRDPSTVGFRTETYLRQLFSDAGLGEPARQRFQVSYRAADLVARSFPADGDRAGLLRLIEASVDGDTLGLSAQRTEGGVRVAYPSVVLSARKPERGAA